MSGEIPEEALTLVSIYRGDNRELGYKESANFQKQGYKKPGEEQEVELGFLGSVLSFLLLCLK